MAVYGSFARNLNRNILPVNESDNIISFLTNET